MRTLLLVVPSILLLVACASRDRRGDAFPFGDPGSSPRSGFVTDPSGSDHDLETVTLHVDGLTCPLKCPREIRAMLADVPGVVNVNVDVPSRSVTVDVLRGTDPETIVDAIKAPYRARRI
jgi:copper chaperone CopZ